MGFQVNRNVYLLRFANPEYEGLQVRCRAPNMGVFLDISEMADLDIKQVSAKDIGKVNLLFEHFADSVIDWNLEDEGVPVPATVDGLKTLDLNFVLDTISAWMEALAGTKPGLPKPSESGQPSLEASIPMEDWSQSLQSLHEPA